MAKISISLPDELKAQVDSYAQEKSMSVSDVVQSALTKLFEHPPGPPIPPPPASKIPKEVASRLTALERYVLRLADNEEKVRESIQFLAQLSSASGGPPVPCPAPLPPPPWQ